MKVSICQTNMAWTIEENTTHIINWIKKSKEQGADLALFTECAITGYHRNIPKICQALDLNRAFTDIQACVDQLKIAVIVGSPVILGNNPKQVSNSALLFKPNATLETTSKIGLTQGEQRFFTPGHSRIVFKIENHSIGVVFCREILDQTECYNDYHDQNLDLLVWPSYIKWDANPDTTQDYCNLDDGIQFSQRLHTPILNINSANSLNDDTLTGLGGSCYITDGTIQSRCAFDQEEILVVEI